MEARRNLDRIAAMDSADARREMDRACPRRRLGVACQSCENYMMEPHCSIFLEGADAMSEWLLKKEDNDGSGQLRGQGA